MSGTMHMSCLRKDAYVVYNTVESCKHALGEWDESDTIKYADADEAPGASMDLREVIFDEHMALRECIETGERLVEALEARGAGLKEALARAESEEEEEQEE